MGRKPSGTHDRAGSSVVTDRPIATQRFEPMEDYFERCIVLASRMIEERKEPPWLREGVDLAELEQRYGVPSNVLLRLALAYHLMLEEDPPPSLKEIRRWLDAGRLSLEKARDGLRKLSSYPPHTLRPQCVSVQPLPTDALELVFSADPIADALEAIDRLLSSLQQCAPAPQVGGRRLSPEWYAFGRLQSVAKQHNPSQTKRQLKSLCEELFDPIREHHGHQSRSPSAEPGETPRTSDTLMRSRKTRQKPV